jgi:hypothetical protein
MHRRGEEQLMKRGAITGKERSDRRVKESLKTERD